MSLSQLMQEIEGNRFSAYINAASGLSVVRMEFESNELLENLTNELQHSPQNKQHIFQRLLELLAQNDEPEYAHPRDVAIAAYLEGLSRVDGGLTGKAVEQILQTPQLWWARRLATHILEKSKTATESVWMEFAKLQFAQGAVKFDLWSPGTKNVGKITRASMVQKTVSFSNRTASRTQLGGKTRESHLTYNSIVSKTSTTSKQGVM